MKVKGNAGEHLTVLPPYGYMKSSDDKKQWVKDEEAAQVVYEIGLYIMDGLGPSQIARKLTERKILTPAAYYASKGRTTNVTKKGSPYAWDSSTIADIMDRWREYLGHTVNFKTRKKSYKSKKTLHNPESEWKIFENTHEASFHLLFHPFSCQMPPCQPQHFFLQKNPCHRRPNRPRWCRSRGRWS